MSINVNQKENPTERFDVITFSRRRRAKCSEAKRIDKNKIDRNRTKKSKSKE